MVNWGITPECTALPRRGRHRRATARIPVVVALALGAAACRDSGGDAAGPCGPITREALQDDSLLHMLRDPGPGAYRSDPPTSGPHQPAPPVHGVVDRPLVRPVQVGILEGGDVLVQFRPADLDTAARAALRSLVDDSEVGDRVVVAPNADLPAPVVATAWTYKRTCDGVDVAALTTFARQRIGHGPDDG